MSESTRSERCSTHGARRSALGDQGSYCVDQPAQRFLVTAPDSVRGRFRKLRTKQLIIEVARVRPGAHGEPTLAGMLMAAKALADRVLTLDQQIASLTAELDDLTVVLSAALRSAYGVGPDTAAQLLVTAGDNPQRLRGEASFAALCGAAPVPAFRQDCAPSAVSRWRSGGEQRASPHRPDPPLQACPAVPRYRTRQCIPSMALRCLSTIGVA
jgi:transposase